MNKITFNCKKHNVKFMLLILVLLLSGLSMKAQVTIGAGVAPDSSSLLDLKENENGTSTKGLLMPRVSLTSTSSFAPMVAHVNGMLVYNTATVGDVTPGYYYNDGSKWLRLSSQSWLVTSANTSSNSVTDDIYHTGSVNIGTTAVDSSAILNVSSSNKGVLLPKVALTSPTDIVTIKKPTEGLLIYNTGENANFKTSGYLFWNGSEWKLFSSGSSSQGSATINCSGATLSPSQQITGGTDIIHGTVIQIPYSVGNGGSFNGVTLTSKGNSNVIGTIADGVLSVGNGVINISLTGTPTVDQQAPNGITFDLTPFLEANPEITGCDEITVGNTLDASIESNAVMGYLMYTEDNTGNDTGTSGYTLQCDSPDGKFSIRVRVASGVNTIAIGNQYINIQVRNNQATAQTVIWNYNTIYSGGMVQTSGMLAIPSQCWGGTNSDTGSTWANASAYTTAYGGYWGNPGIYDGLGPEYRRYTWIPLGAENNVSYEATVMCALDSSTPTAATVPTLLKTYIKLQQVTASN